MKLDELMNLMNYNLHRRKSENPSSLGEIEIMICEGFFASNPSLEKKQLFESNLVGTPVIFDNPENYKSVETVYPVYNDLSKSSNIERVR